MPPLLVGVNVRPALWSNTGIARVVLNLMRTLPPIAPEWSFLLYCPRLPEPNHPLLGIIASNQNCQLRLVRGRSTVLFETVCLPHAIRSDKVDVFLATVPETRLAAGKPTLLTMHDTIPELFPQSSPRRLRLLRATGLVRRNVSRCSEVLCFSNHTANDVARVFGTHADRLTVVHLGVDPGIQRMGRDAARASVEQRFGIEAKYFLMLHVAEYGEFFRAYATYLQGTPDPIPLVVVCGEHRASRMRAEVDQLHLGNSVLWLNHVTDTELSALYSACYAFVYPSLYEGFGLPVLEALTCGALCIAYRVSSLPEVLGNAGLLIDPDDLEGLIGILRDVTRDTTVRAKYQEAIDKQAGNFGWELAAQVVRSSLERISLRSPV